MKSVFKWNKLPILLLCNITDGFKWIFHGLFYKIHQRWYNTACSIFHINLFYYMVCWSVNCGYMYILFAMKTMLQLCLNCPCLSTVIPCEVQIIFLLSELLNIVDTLQPINSAHLWTIKYMWCSITRIVYILSYHVTDFFMHIPETSPYVDLKYFPCKVMNESYQPTLEFIFEVYDATWFYIYLKLYSSLLRLFSVNKQRTYIWNMCTLQIF